MVTPITFLLLLLVHLHLSDEASTPGVSLSSSSFSFPLFHPTSALALLGDAHLSPPSSSVTMTSGAVLRLPSLPFGGSHSFSSRLSFSLSPHTARLALVLSPNLSFPPLPTFVAEFGALAPPSGEKLRSWVEFHGQRGVLDLRIANASDPRPLKPIASYSVDLAHVLQRKELFVGLCSYGGNSTQLVNVYDWSFEVRNTTPYLMHSVPLDPSAFGKQSEHPVAVIGRKENGALDFIAVLAIVAACVAMVTFLAVLALSGRVDRHQVAPVERSSLSLVFGYEKISEAGEKGLENGGAKNSV